MPITLSRRGLLSELAAAAAIGGAAVTESRGVAKSFATDPPPEVTTIRIDRDPGICIAPQYLAEALLRAEGFTDVRYAAPTWHTGAAPLASGAADLGMDFAAHLLTTIEAGAPLSILAGVHAGCIELFANATVGSIADLKGRTIGTHYGSADSELLKIMVRSVGLDPARDIRWLVATRRRRRPSC